MRVLFIVVRTVVAVSIAAAIVGQLLHSLVFYSATSGFDSGFFTANFFSFFTIDSNVASVVVLLVGAALALRRAVVGVPAGASGDVDPLLYTTVRASVATYMITTGIVYNLLLRGIALPQGQTLEWSNEILHVIGPLYLLLDWLFAPGRVRLSYRRLWAIVSFPLVWLAYTLIRGPLAVDPLTGTNWYPYPFLNPALASTGYLSVALYVVGISLVISAIGLGVIRVSRLAPREAPAAAAPAPASPPVSPPPGGAAHR